MWRESMCIRPCWRGWRPGGRRPVWVALEETGVRKQLAHAHSNGARRGRKSDFRDAERLVHRLVAGELVLSYVPQDEQQGWRWLPRTRYQLGCERGRVQ